MRTAVLAAALFVAYVSSARLGLELSVAHGVITPVWAPTGISLAALVLYGPRLWPAVALGAFVANATSGASVPEAAFISIGNTLEALVGSVLLRRFEFRAAVDRVRDVFVLILFGAVLARLRQSEAELADSPQGFLVLAWIGHGFHGRT